MPNSIVHDLPHCEFYVTTRLTSSKKKQQQLVTRINFEHEFFIFVKLKKDLEKKNKIKQRRFFFFLYLHIFRLQFAVVVVELRHFFDFHSTPISINLSYTSSSLCCFCHGLYVRVDDHSRCRICRGRVAVLAGSCSAVSDHLGAYLLRRRSRSRRSWHWPIASAASTCETTRTTRADSCCCSTNDARGTNRCARLRVATARARTPCRPSPWRASDRRRSATAGRWPSPSRPRDPSTSSF